jgi:penicillin-binding protein 2
MFGEDDVVRSHKSRLDILGNIVVLAFVVIAARLWYLQIYKGEQFYNYSIQNRLRKEVIKAPRGMIFSRNNEMLVSNVPRFDAVVVPQYLKNEKESLRKLAQVLGTDIKDIEKELRNARGQASYRPVTIKRNISRREVAIIETESSKMPGAFVQTFISRQYLDNEVGGHLLGYISEISQEQLPRLRKRDDYPYLLGDFIGQSGLEEEFDLYLRGEDGHEFMEVDARGRMRRHLGTTHNLFAGIKNKAAEPGHNIRLTIDRDLQLSAYESLGDKVGGVVVVDVHSGEILSMVSKPSFDPTQFSKGLTLSYWSELINNPLNPLRDRTIQEHYSPGSVYKTVTAIAGLEEDIIDPEEEIMCRGTFRLGRRVYHDWKRSGHGMTDVYKSLRESVDVYYYKLATELDIDVLARYSKLLGFGRKTGIELPQETSGLIPTREWKKKRNGEDWQLGETLSCAIGQSYVLTTPLQLAMAYAAIANEGKLMRPQVVKEIFSNNGEVIRKTEPEVVDEMNFDEKTYKAIKRGLYEVVNKKGGTAWWYRGRGIRMAGKTGTSQVRSMTSKELFSKCSEMPYDSRHHGLFVAYAPAENPQVAVSVIVEHGCSGSSSAAPIARDVLTTYMKKYQPEVYAEYEEEDRKEAIRLWREAKRREEEQAAAEAAEAAEEATPVPTNLERGEE